MLVLLLSGGGEALGAASPPSPPPPRWSVDENAAVLGGERKGPARVQAVCIRCVYPAEHHGLSGRWRERQGFRARWSEDPGHQTTVE